MDRIHIVGRHMTVSDETKQFTLDKFKPIDRFFHGVQRIEVILKPDDRKQHCEVLIHIKNKGDIVIDVARDDLHEAIDVAVNKCERQLRRTKEKMKDKRRHAGDNEALVGEEADLSEE